jgi:hypothetical protein
MWTTCIPPAIGSVSPSAMWHQLGSIAEGQRDFAAVERWYLKSLKITEKLGNERGAAIAYGQLAIENDFTREVARKIQIIDFN